MTGTVNERKEIELTQKVVQALQNVDSMSKVVIGIRVQVGV